MSYFTGTKKQLMEADDVKSIIKRIPILGTMARALYRKLKGEPPVFVDSERYWIDRYRDGGNSGPGSYLQLAEFKAEIVNAFVCENNVATVIEHGCGDGNQLLLAKYPSYLGFDVSPKAIQLCRRKFRHDNSKRFMLSSEYSNEAAMLTLSLDVIFHLVEDGAFVSYMTRLFKSSQRFVIIYSSNTDENQVDQPAHVRHRRFTDWIESELHEWELTRYIRNQHPFAGDPRTGSFSDFYFFAKTCSTALP